MKHIFRPSKLPLCSRIVIKSANTWQGWAKSVRPLMIGMVPFWASASTSDCLYVRIMMPSR